jgi:hypothetical protein
LVRVLVGRAGEVLLLIVALGTLCVALIMLATLTHGYVLLAIPPLLARTATALGIGTVPALLLMVVRLPGPSLPVRASACALGPPATAEP